MKQLQLNPVDLKPHPLLARMAMESEAIAWLAADSNPDNEAELERRRAARAALFTSIEMEGVVEPIRVVSSASGWLIADGRHRAEGTAACGKLVPAVEVTEAEARRIIFTSFVHRRHMSKGALAWLAVSMNPEVAKTQAGRPNSHSVGITTRASLAEQAGVSLPLIDQACRLWEITAKVSKLRAKVDAGIAAGAGLGALIAGLEGAAALPTGDDGKAKRPPSNVNSYCRTITTIGTQLKAFADWGEAAKADAVDRTAQILRANESARQLFAAALIAAAEPEAAAE